MAGTRPYVGGPRRVVLNCTRAPETLAWHMPRSHVMSSLFLHVGQCGNQIGQAFWNDVEEWYEAKPLEQIPSRRTTLGGRGMKPARTDHVIHVPFSFLDGTLPCVLVDTEPKVVKSCCKGGALAKRVPPTSQLFEKSGRGNNWAYGYYGKSSHGQSRDSCLKDSVQECVRNVVERCDCFMGTVLFHSIAGGTGSGVFSAAIGTSVRLQTCSCFICVFFVVVVLFVCFVFSGRHL